MSDLPRAELDDVPANRVRARSQHELARFSGLDLPEANLSGISLKTCLLERATLTRAMLRDALFDEVVLEDCDLSSARLTGATLTDVTFRRCKLLGVDWTKTRRSLIGEPLRFEECILDFGLFHHLDLKASLFEDCSAREADFAGADLSDATFHRTDLERATFGGTKLTNTDLTSARGYALDPRENDVRGMKVSLPEGATLLRSFGINVEPV